MIFAYPEYYKEFKCIASDCRHSCCIGWEIDLDPATACLYKNTEGPLGEKMERCIAWGDEPHFILGENERCPFLNGDNLCEIILELGEEAISQICTEHPRFRNYMSERTEIGLGLCCEEAARLIVSREKPFELVEEGEGEYTADEDYLMDLRDEAFEIMNDTGLPLLRRMAMVLELCEANLPRWSIAQWGHFFIDLERLDEAWTICLRSIVRWENGEQSAEAFMEAHSREFGNLFVYFLYRHLFTALDDGDIGSKAAFAYLSCLMIAAATLNHGAAAGTETIAECARMYSSEIEYSDENLEIIFDRLK